MRTRDITLPSGTKVELQIGNKQRMFAGLALYLPTAEDAEPRVLTVTQKIEQAETFAELACLAAPDLKITTRKPVPSGMKDYNELPDADWDYLFSEVMDLWREAAEAANPSRKKVSKIKTAS